jgi:hypothetical protein
MNRPSVRTVRALAAASALGAASLIGLASASTAGASTLTTTKMASPAVTTSLQTVIWHPPYGCFVCGLGGFDPTIGGPGDPGPLAGGPIAF